MVSAPRNRIIRRFPETDSTNDLMTRLIKEGIDFITGDIVISESQIAGRGNGKNSWESETGNNLTFSVYFKTKHLTASQQFFLNMAVSLSVLDFVSSKILKKKVSIKWPNDIYIGKKKVAGLLINHAVSGNSLLYSVIGIGLNVNQRIFKSEAPNPTSLVHYHGHDLNLELCLNELSDFLVKRFDQVEHGEFKQLKSNYLAALFAFKTYRDYLYENSRITAKITGVSEFGSLILEGENGEELQCDLKEIKFIL